jgi:hypothetical protein
VRVFTFGIVLSIFLLIGLIAFVSNRTYSAYKTYRTHMSYRSYLSKSAKEYSIHSVSLDGDEFGIVGASPTIESGYKVH